MQLLLINNNPAVSRLITLSVEKMGLSINEIADFESYDGSQCDIALVDSDLYDESAVSMFKNMGLCSHLVYIGARGSDKPSEMDSMLEKPFLPTDFIEMIEAIKQNLTTTPPIDEPAPMDTFEEEEGLDEEIDALDEVEEETAQESGEVPLEENTQSSIDLDDEESLDDVFDNLESMADLDETEEESESLQDDTSIEEESLDDIMGNLGELEDDEDPLSEDLTLEDNTPTEETSLDDIMGDLGELEEDAAPLLEEDAEAVVLDSEEIREVKELLEDAPEEEEIPELESEEESSLDSFDTQSLGDDFALEEENDDSEQSVEELMEAIDAMDVPEEDEPEKNEAIEDALGEFELPSLESEEDEMITEEETADIDEALEESLVDDPMAILEELEADTTEESFDEELDIDSAADEDLEDEPVALEENTEEEIEEEMAVDPLEFLKELESDEEELDQEEPVEEANEEDVEVPESALLDDEEDEDEDSFDEPEIESIEGSEDAKPIASGDIFDLLDEASLKAAFGESVEDVQEENEEALSEDVVEEVVDQEDVLSQLKEDIESNVSQSLGSVLAKSEIKEALKGMKININITFEEE